MTPDEEFLAAADRVEALAIAITPGPWGVYEDGEDHYLVDYSGDDEGIYGPVADNLEHDDALWIANLGPQNAADLATLFRDAAVFAKSHDEHHAWLVEREKRTGAFQTYTMWPNWLTATHRIARRINGGTS